MGEQFKIRFIRNFTLEAIEIWLKRELQLSALSVECQFGGFAEAAGEIEALVSAGGDTDADLIVLALGLELTAADFGRRSWSADAACQRHMMLVRAAIEACSKPLVINTVLPPLFSATGLAIDPSRASHAALADQVNSQLRALAAQYPGQVALIDWAAIARVLGEKGTYDYRFWLSSGAPFASAFLTQYAAGLSSVVRSLTGKARKCLVLDCDNTLWGGIVGEDGRQGISLAPDSLPGAYFQAFQRSVLDLQSRGVVIALCSKNNEAEVLDVLDNHPDCLLGRQHIAAWRINWNNKAQSIAEIAIELNLGLDAFVFVDDSAIECQLVQSTHPDVLVLQTPSRLEELVTFLDRRHLFDALVVTEDDARRSRTYQEDRARVALSAATQDLSEYKQQLGVRLTVRKAQPADLARIGQLIQRTNQFNLTTRRHDSLAIARMHQDPDALLLCAELGDRFGDLGLIGAAIAFRAGREAIIDSMFMSCRALGRDAELAFAATLFTTICAEWGAERVSAEYIATNKNTLVADFWLRMGLVPEVQADGASGTVHFVSTGDLAALAASSMPPHITLMDCRNER